MSSRNRISKKPTGKILQSWLASNNGKKYAGMDALAPRQQAGRDSRRHDGAVTLAPPSDGNENYAKMKRDFEEAANRVRCLEEILSATKQLESASPETGPSVLELQAKFIEEEKERSKRIAMLNRFLAVAKQKCLSLQGQLDEVVEQKELLHRRVTQLEKSLTNAADGVVSGTNVANCQDAAAAEGGVRDTAKVDLNNSDAESPCEFVATEDVFSFTEFLDEQIASCNGDIEQLILTLSEPQQKDLLIRVQTVLGFCQRWLKLPANQSLWDEQINAEDEQGSH